MNDWALIIDEEPLPGSWNMAVDEYLFLSLKQNPQTVVRFYRWAAPTVSLGCSQEAPDTVNLDFCRKNGIDLVRRITGGKLVLHHHEITYSVCSAGDPAFGSSLPESYRRISLGLLTGLEKMGLHPRLAPVHSPSYTKVHALCFSQPARDEIEIGGKKIVGSAQKRAGSRFLQHGSLLLQADMELFRGVSLHQPADGLRMTSLSEELGRAVDFDWAVAHLYSGFSEHFGIEFLRRTLSEDDREAISRLQKERYEDPAWTFRSSRGS